MARLERTTPVLRSFDAAKAREFYVDFLGFAVTFTHRFGDDFPLYMGLERDSCELHLSEHHGDATPGTHLRIQVDDVRAFIAGLAAKHYRYAKPGIPMEPTPWGTLECTIGDPFGNRLTFWQEAEAAGVPD